MSSTHFIKLSLPYFWYFAVIGLTVPFLGVYLDGKEFSSFDIGKILAIITATKIAGPALWAQLADKTGQQLNIIRLGVLLSLIFFSTLLWVESYWPIVCFLALFNLCFASVLPQLEVMTLNEIQRNAKVYGRIRLWGSIGFIVIVIITGDVIERFSASAFVYLGLITLIGLLHSTLLVKQVTLDNAQVNFHSSIIDKITAPTFIVFFLAGMLLQISFAPYYGFFALYLRDLSYSGLSIGLLLAIGVVAEIIVFIFVGRIFQRFSIQPILVFCMLATALRWYVIGNLADNIALLILSQVIHAASFGLYHSASIAFIHQHFESSQQSRGQAIYIGGVYGIGGAIGAYFSGMLWLDGLGAQQTFNMAAGIALCAGLIATFNLKK